MPLEVQPSVVTRAGKTSSVLAYSNWNLVFMDTTWYPGDFSQSGTQSGGDLPIRALEEQSGSAFSG